MEIRNAYGFAAALPEWAGPRSRWAVVESTIILVDPERPPHRYDAAHERWEPLELAVVPSKVAVPRKVVTEARGV